MRQRSNKDASLTDWHRHPRERGITVDAGGDKSFQRLWQVIASLWFIWDIWPRDVRTESASEREAKVAEEVSPGRKLSEKDEHLQTLSEVCTPSTLDSSVTCCLMMFLFFSAKLCYKYTVAIWQGFATCGSRATYGPNLASVVTVLTK